LRKKGKYRRTTQDRLSPERIGLLLGLLLGYLEYFLDLRPKLAGFGLYELGFIDCLLLVISIVLFAVTSKKFVITVEKQKE